MLKTKEIKGDIQHVRANIVPNSFKKESRTVDVIFATENPVRTYHWEIGAYMEILDMNSKSIRADRASNGLPVFDSHYPRTAMMQLGKAENIEFNNKQGTATIRLGSRADEALINDIESGIIDGISVGYNIYKLILERQVEGELPVYRAVDWEPMEISFAPVQADYNSKIRSENADHSITIVSLNKNQKMTIAEIRASASSEQLARLDAIVSIVRAAKLSDEKAVELYESDKTLEVIRSENPEKQEPVKPVNEPVQVDVNKIRQEANDGQRARLDAILKSTRAAKMEDSKAIEFFTGEKTIEQIRQEIIDSFVQADPNKDSNHNASITGKEAIEKKREAAEQAVLHRIAPKQFELAKVDGARDMAGLSIHEIACVLQAERTGKAIFIGKAEMADQIFGKRTHGTSDFPLLLENLAEKLLRADYQMAPEFWSMIARETSVRDFKAKALYQVDSTNGMKEIPEGGEINYTTLSEAKQTIKVKKYAEGIKFTREAYINDDLGAFVIIPNKFVVDWNTLRGDLVWGLITANSGAGATMADAKTLFHADHKNLQQKALDEEGLTAADILFMNQTGLDGKRKIRVTPRFLIVSPDYKIQAKKLMTAITATKTGDVNVFNGVYEPIVEPRLTGLDWFLAADPAMIDGLYYAYLNGNSALRSNRVDDFDTDSIKFGVRGEFGVQVIDHRGWLRSKAVTQG